MGRFSGKKLKVGEVKKGVSPMAPKSQQFMPGVRQLLSATAGCVNRLPDLSYMETYSKLCKELKQNAMKKQEDKKAKSRVVSQSEGVEEVYSDDEDFDTFLEALDEEQFNVESGGVQIDDVTDDEVDDGEEENDAEDEGGDSEDDHFDLEQDLEEAEGDEDAEMVMEDSDFEQ